MGTILGWLFGTHIGQIIAGVIVLLLIAVAVYAWLTGGRIGAWVGSGIIGALILLAAVWYGVHLGTVRMQARVDAANAAATEARNANSADEATIRTLHADNARMAAAAAADKARADQAAVQLASVKQASDATVAQAQQRLKDYIHAHPNAAAIGNARMPAGVLDQLCQRAAHCPDPNH